MGADQYNIDGHKLHLHPERVAQWLQNKPVVPLYIEISPSGTCNHRCVFCSMDFMGYRKRFLDSEMLLNRLRECAGSGLRSLMFAGEGEPLLHKDICAFAEAAHGVGIDVAFTTNGVLLDKKRAERLLAVSSWIKISCNGASPEDYARVHRTKAEDFEQVMRNVAGAAKLRSTNGDTCAIGLQCILLPDQAANMPALARRAREAGADYLVIKPYSQHPLSHNCVYADIQYDGYADLAEALAKEENENFKVIFRNEAMSRWDSKKADFDCCLALPFWAFVDSGANIWGCSRHLNDENFYYGNLADKSFAEIWASAERQAKIRACQENMDISKCHVTCRMEAVNNYLWRLIHPASHDNFI